MRKAKIVNIEGKGNTKVKDPYGVDHILPENADMKINSFNNRGIKITEIK